jgi:SAM-dependent methyltransferase
MSADLPSPWAQECPRSVRLSPGDILVPAGALRALLRKGGSLTLRYTGFALEPAIRSGDLLAARALAGDPVRGMLVLCDRDGWADVVRVAGAPGPVEAIVGVDALPGSRRVLRRADILATIVPPGRRDASPTTADRLRLAARWPAIRFAWRRVERAPSWESDAGLTVLEKYRQQVEGYRDGTGSNLTDALRETIRRHAGPGGDVLVAGCGAGSEAIDLCRTGFRVAAFDALPEMIAAARQTLEKAGATADLSVANLQDFDPGGRRFGAIYFTPDLYGFVPGRARRVAAVRRLGRSLAPGGALLFGVARPRLLRRAQAFCSWARRRLRGDRLVERGDWFTWFLTPAGDIGTSYVHLFGGRREVEAELRAAGYGKVRFDEGHVIATDPRDPDRSPARNHPPS